MATTFPYDVTVTPIGLPGQCAGARKPGTSKGFLVINNTSPSNLTNGVIIGNFCYAVAETEDRAVQNNVSASGATITGSATLDTIANIAGYTTPTITFSVDGQQFSAPVTGITTGDTYPTLAGKVQAAMRTAAAGTPAANLTMTWAGTRYVFNTNVAGNNHPLVLTTTQLATGMGLTTASGAVSAASTAGQQLAGLVTRANTYVSTDLGAIFYGDGYSNVVSAGNIVDVAQRGDWYVSVAGFLNGAISVSQYAVVYSRNTDGAVFLANPGTGDVTGYTMTNFVMTSVGTAAIVGAIVRIANDEKVSV